MIKVWDIQMQITTPEDLDSMEMEQKLEDLLEEEDIEANYLFATLAGKIEDEEDLEDKDEDDD